ncbi:hypothetical protein EYR36_006994 [Pleurotus pulmonarius]|nr:hypothetical protein EYR36_006994 [Pleurotus pulmonarius]
MRRPAVSSFKRNMVNFHLHEEYHFDQRAPIGDFLFLRHSRIQNGVDDGNNTPKVSTLTLDSIIYTTDDNPNAFNATSNVFLAPKQQEKKKRILEAAVTSGLAGVGFISLSFWLCIRRKQHKPLLPSLPTVFRHQPTSRPRTITPYSKRSSSLHRSQFERRGDGDDDARSFLSIVPPSYHSRLSNIP